MAIKSLCIVLLLVVMTTVEIIDANQLPSTTARAPSTSTTTNLDTTSPTAVATGTASSLNTTSTSSQAGADATLIKPESTSTIVPMKSKPAATLPTTTVAGSSSSSSSDPWSQVLSSSKSSENKQAYDMADCIQRAAYKSNKKTTCDCLVNSDEVIKEVPSLKEPIDELKKTCSAASTSRFVASRLLAVVAVAVSLVHAL